MRKFLCYDTNDAASGKINVDNRGMLKPNSTVPSTNGASCQQLVTDGEGGVKWEDRLAYDDSRVVVDWLNGRKYVKVFDEIPSWASVDTPMKIWMNNEINSETVNSGDYIDLGNGSFACATVTFIATDNFEISNGENTTIVFPEKGVYFESNSDFYVSGIASADFDTPEITWDGNVEFIKTIDPKYIPSELNEIILPSSTSGSSKKFKITVDDSGAISATEV